MLATLAGIGLVAYAFSTALYILVLTSIVAVAVWPMLARKGRRRASHFASRALLLFGATAGFWIVTTTAVRFADSSGAEDGAGASSLVNVSPWGHDEDPSGLLKSGLVSALGVSAIAFALASRRRRAD